MRLHDMRTIYPATAHLIRRLADEHRIDLIAAETLTPGALQRIEDGVTPQRDAVQLLQARTATRRRQR